jgi:signal transduction histidine kinase
MRACRWWRPSASDVRLVRIPLAWAGAAAALVALAAAADVSLPAWLLVPTCALSYVCGAYSSPVVGAAGVVLLLGALRLQESDAVPLLLATVGPWGVGRAVRSRQELVATLEQRNRELTAEQDAYARLSVQRERARIARELHDIVSHHLAVMVIQAGAGRVGMDTTARDVRLDSIRESGGHALAEMDRLVAMLQTDDEAAPASDGRLQLLLDQAHATGLDLRAEPLPEGADLATEVVDSAYRVVQEGLTNAMKHAPGAVVRLRLAVNAGALELELVDSGGAAVSQLARTGGGHGLAGMRERVAALGGTFEAGPDGSGWRVFARIPARPRPTSVG